MNYINLVDATWLNLMTSNRSHSLVLLCNFLDFVGFTFIYLFLFAVICYYAYIKNFYMLIFYIISITTMVFMTQIIKRIICRARPNIDPLNLHEGFSFPSGHVAVTTCFVAILLFHYKNIWIKIFGLFFILLMMWSRTYLGVHYLTDVLSGGIVGTLSVCFTKYIISKNKAIENLHNSRI